MPMSDRTFDPMHDQADGLSTHARECSSVGARAAAPLPKVIAISSGKGGVGKTSISVNLGVALAQTGQRVMLLDGDLSLANVDVMLGLTPSRNLSHVLEGQCRLEDILLDGPCGLMVVPASSGKKKMADLSRFENAAIVRVFSELQCPVDTLIVDTAAGIPDSVLTLTAAAQEILVVVTNDPASITDAYALIKVLSKEHGVNRIQILANQVAGLNEAQELFAGLERVTERFLNVTLALAGAIPQDNWLKSAVRKQRAVVEVFPSSPSAIAIQALARRVESWAPSVSQGRLEFFVERRLSNLGCAV